MLLGCNEGNRKPQVGSMVHPETNLTQFSNDQLIRYYYFFSPIVANQERNIHLLATNKVGLSTAIVYDLEECKERYAKNKAAEERIIEEINRRGLSIEKRPIKKLEFGISFLNVWTITDPDTGRSIQQVDVW